VTTTDVFGADLHVGDVLVEHMPDGTSVEHLIDRFVEYPCRFIGAGDHARRAYDADGHWCATVADRERFHVQSQED
jgi:hypothetical protein